MPKLGPHEEREVDLLLAGEKRCAMFYFDEEEGPEGRVPEEIYPLVAEGRLSMLEYVSYALPSPVVYQFFTLPGEEWRAKTIFLLNHIWTDKSLPVSFTVDDIRRMEGGLLDYDRADIDFFIAHVNRDAD